MKRILTTFTHKWPEYLLEILVITIGVISAYSLNDWSERNKKQNAEIEILSEIKSNLQLDLIDLKGNRDGHAAGLGMLDSLRIAGEYQLTNNQLGLFFYKGFRDYVYLPQTSAFETLKGKGVDLISKDSLRIDILRLYDFHYNSLIQLEGQYKPSEFTEDYRYILNNYFKRFSHNLDSTELSTIVPSYHGYDWIQRADVQVRIDRIMTQRLFVLNSYDGVIQRVNGLIGRIEKELEWNEKFPSSQFNSSDSTNDSLGYQ